ncbi:hypothetical protein JCM3263A_05620 [Thermobifida fusca]
MDQQRDCFRAAGPRGPEKDGAALPRHGGVPPRHVVGLCRRTVFCLLVEQSRAALSGRCRPAVAGARAEMSCLKRACCQGWDAHRATGAASGASP